MGVVWRAEHVTTGAQAALKLLSPGDGGDAGAAERFRVEVHAMRRIVHPGVVRVLDHGAHEGAPWYAMELVPGQPMGSALSRSGVQTAVTSPEVAELDATIREIASRTSRFLDDDDLSAVHDAPAWHRSLDEAKEASDVEFSPTITLDAVGVTGSTNVTADTLPDASREEVRRALGWVGQVCETLAYLHGEGWVHRDIKPDNVMIRPDGRAMLLDFGLASEFDGRLGRDAIRDAGLRMGTLSYIAPEQIEGQLVDARADLYSIGCILYEILTGRPPFDAASPLALMMKHAASPHVVASSRARNVPPELSALVDSLLAKHPRDRPGSGAVVAQTLRSLGVEVPPWEGAPPTRTHLYTAEFAGRQAELNALESLRKLAGRGEGAVSWIAGESGSGKTRLALEVAKRARQREAIILTAQCAQLDATIEGQTALAAPLHAFLGPLRAIADECVQRGQEYTQWVFADDRAARLAPFAPFLVHLPGATTSGFPSLSAREAQRRIRAAMREVFEAFIDLQPCVLIFDDLQWADEFSLDVLEDLIDLSSKHRRWLLLGTFRAEERTPRLDAIVNTERKRQVHLELEALSDEAVGQIVSGMLGVAQAEPVLSTFVSRRSGGNPFFVAEYLRLLVDSEFLQRDARGVWALADASRDTNARLATLPTPESVVALAADRLGGLDEASRALAAAVALVGRQAPISVAAALCELEDNRVAAATYELGRARILEAVGHDLRFTHDKLREAAYAIIPGESRPPLHARAAALMEDAGATAAELAHHLDLAGDTDAALERYLEAAQEASGKHTFRASERHARRALELARPGSHQEVLARLALARDVFFKESRYGEMRHVLEGTEEMARHVSPPDVRMILASAMGEALRLTGEPLEGMAMLERARDLYFEHPEQIDAGSRVMNNLGIAYQGRGMLEQAAVCYRFVLRNRDSVHDFVAASMLSNLGVIERRQGRIEEAMRCYEESLLIHERIGNSRSVAITLGNLSSLHLALGNVSRALELGERGLIMRRVSGDIRGTSQNLRGLARALIASGQIERAREHAEQAIAQVHTVSSQRQRANCFCALGEVLLAEERYEDATVPFDQSVDMARASGDMNLHALILLYRALAQTRLGEVGAARRDLHEANEVMPDEHRLRAFHDLAYAETHLVAGEPRLARARCVSALEHYAPTQRTLDILEAYSLLLRALVESGLDPSATIREADEVHARVEGQARLIERRYLDARARALSSRR
jgi:predicted ATPase